jgi:hypothetical protein
MPSAAANARHNPYRSKAAPVPVASNLFEPAHRAARNATPANETPMCAYIKFQCGRGVPVTKSTIPVPAPKAMKSQAVSLLGFGWRKI